MSADAVSLYTSPWVSGTRVEKYFGPVMADLFVIGADEVEWYEAELNLLEAIKTKAGDLGANSVVGVDVTLDPFALCPKTGAKGLRLLAVGTAAHLVPLWE